MFYHKYRPKFFREIIGQEIVLKILKSFLKLDKPPHGYLFAGDRGTGKTSVARIYAKALNCLNLKDSEPCGQCRNCRLFHENKFLDLVELDAASNRKIEDIRNIKEHIGFKPIHGRYKVFIIDEAHSLTEEASNALLKTLEEPPAHAIFILATTEPDRILSTIHSRVQRLDFQRIGLSKIVLKLKMIAEAEGIKYEDPALYLIAEESAGSLRDAETILEKVSLSLNPHNVLTEDLVAQALGHLSFKKTLDFLEIVFNKKTELALNFIHQIYFEGNDIHLFIKSLLRLVRQLILAKNQPLYFKHLETEKPKELIEKMKVLVNKTSLEDLKKLTKLLFEAHSNLRKEPPLLILPLELAIIEFCEFSQK